MKYQKYYKIVLPILISFFFGCTKSYIYLDPESTLTTNAFLSSRSDVNQAVLAIYAELQSRYPKDYQLFELSSDNMYLSSQSSIVNGTDIDALSINSSNGLLQDYWSSCYRGIFRANLVLGNIDRPKDYNEGEQNQFKGEALFLRALFYFDLVKVFGGVPDVENALSISDASKVSRSSKEDIYALIEKDLKDAQELIPLKSKTQKGRVSKEGALALLSKVYVYNEDWNNAKDILQSFLTEYSTSYALVTDYGQLWNISSENNSEIIFSIKYTDGTNGHGLSTAFVPNDGLYGVVNRGAEMALPSWGLEKLYNTGDSRKNSTIKDWYVGASSAIADSVRFSYISKFAVPHTFNASGLDLPVLRLSDIVLLYAETLAELGRVDESLAQLNKIRERAFHSSVANYTSNDFASDKELIDLIIKERRLEFAFECERWFDLTRTGRFIEEMKKEERYRNPITGVSQVVTLNPVDYKQVFPIPQNEIDLVGKGILQQNNGY